MGWGYTHTPRTEGVWELMNRVTLITKQKQLEAGQNQKISRIIIINNSTTSEI